MTSHVSLPFSSLLETPNDDIVGRLLRSDAASGFPLVAHRQIGAWHDQLDLLRNLVRSLLSKYPQIAGAHLVLEYRIPRREKRIDAVLLLGGTVVIIEFKVGSSTQSAEAIDQVFDYALDIAYYHAESRGRRLVPILCPTRMDLVKYGSTCIEPRIEPLVMCGADGLPAVIGELINSDTTDLCNGMDAGQWVQSAYRPIPGVIEATVQLFRTHGVEDIKSSLAGNEAIEKTVEYVESLVESARASGSKILCLLTGVPGAGKTLTGLQITHLEKVVVSDWRTVYMSGNGPLLKVLRAALARDYAKREKVSLVTAKSHANALLHSVHTYLGEATRIDAAPTERIVIFDEAQRAWDETKMRKMAGRATRQGAATDAAHRRSEESEPWQILKVLNRHEGGAVIVGLCGNGQEIHDGEAGVSEWVSARDQGFSDWKLVCSPVAAELTGLPQGHANTIVAPEVHLNASLRSHRAHRHGEWVDAVLRGHPDRARQCIGSEAFPIYLTRDLQAARDWLWKTTLGTRRCGLLASSSAARLRPYGVEISAEFRKGIDYALWFTADRSDFRSSNGLEVVATEFECQGLELDRVAVCWSWDMPVINGQLTPRSFRGRAWVPIKGERHRKYAENKYRVLLTRAREAMVVWIPQGVEIDATRKSDEADAIATYLECCGVRALT
jgi:hypothetical protein